MSVSNQPDADAFVQTLERVGLKHGREQDAFSGMCLWAALYYTNR